jgi:hypothetical protein
MRLSASTVIGCDLMGCCLCIELWFCLVALLFQSVLACHLSRVFVFRFVMQFGEDLLRLKYTECQWQKGFCLRTHIKGDILAGQRPTTLRRKVLANLSRSDRNELILGLQYPILCLLVGSYFLPDSV